MVKVNSKMKDRPVRRHVEIGFGEGEILRRTKLREGRILEGVEHRSARRIKIPGVKLEYTGFEHWLKIAKNQSYSTVNAFYFFNNFLLMKYPGRTPGTINNAAAKKTLEEVLNKLAPGGRLNMTFYGKKIPANMPLRIALKSALLPFQEAGFEVSFVKKLKPGELGTASCIHNGKNPNSDALLFSFKRPKNKDIPLEAPKTNTIFIVDPTGRIEPKTLRVG